MATLDVLIDDLVCGDDYDFVRTITGVPIDTSLERAWLTVKRRAWDGDGDAIIAKEIGLIETVGQGHITDSGDNDGRGEVFFQLGAAETAKLEPRRLYVLDLQVRTASGKIYTPLSGHLRAHRSVTRAVGA